MSKEYTYRIVQAPMPGNHHVVKARSVINQYYKSYGMYEDGFERLVQSIFLDSVNRSMVCLDIDGKSLDIGGIVREFIRNTGCLDPAERSMAKNLLMKRSSELMFDLLSVHLQRLVESAVKTTEMKFSDSSSAGRDVGFVD